MKKPKKLERKKLSLNKDTITILNEKDKQQVMGGLNTCGSGCVSTTCPMNTCTFTGLTAGCNCC